MSSQESESDTQFFIDAVNAMDCEEEEDCFLTGVPYDSPPPPHAVPPPVAVPHLQPDDPLLLIPAEDPDEMSSPDYDAPPTPQQVGEKTKIQLQLPHLQG